MADLIDVLPNFDLAQWRHLTYSLEKKNISTAELIALDPVEIARKCPLPLTEVRRLAAAVLQALKADLAVKSDSVKQSAKQRPSQNSPPRKKACLESQNQPLTARHPPCVKTLDPRIDQWLGGGFPVGSICEIVGESAVGKTQFVLSLLMSVQLPLPDGLGKSAIYVSTEGSLNTTRLMQILRAHPIYQDLPVSQQPSLDRVLTVDAPTLEVQERIVHYQLEEVIKRGDVGLVVIDSIAANYRVEYQGASRKVLGERAMALVRLGNTLRKIAHEYRVAVVVTNQVSDRFDDERTIRDKIRLSQSQSQSSQATKTQGSNTTQRPINHSQPDTSVKEAHGPPQSGWPTQILPELIPAASQAKREELLSLDFQQRFFTGWGDDPKASLFEPLKTPALGLAWVNQIDARIVLKVSQHSKHAASETGNIWSDTKRRRYLKLVFASWMKPTVAGIEYQLEMQGPVSLLPKNAKEVKLDDDFDAGSDEDSEEFEKDTEHAELLDPKYWEDEDEEFP